MNSSVHFTSFHFLKALKNIRHLLVGLETKWFKMVTHPVIHWISFTFFGDMLIKTWIIFGLTSIPSQFTIKPKIFPKPLQRHIYIFFFGLKSKWIWPFLKFEYKFVFLISIYKYKWLFLFYKFKKSYTCLFEIYALVNQNNKVINL